MAATTPTRRNRILDDLAAHDCSASSCFAFRTDEALEAAYQVWVAAGSPRGATLRMDNENGREKVVLTVREEPTCAECHPHSRHAGACGSPGCACGKALTW